MAPPTSIRHLQSTSFGYVFSVDTKIYWFKDDTRNSRTGSLTSNRLRGTPRGDSFADKTNFDDCEVRITAVSHHSWLNKVVVGLENGKLKIYEWSGEDLKLEKIVDPPTAVATDNDHSVGVQLIRRNSGFPGTVCAVASMDIFQYSAMDDQEQYVLVGYKLSDENQSKNIPTLCLYTLGSSRNSTGIGTRLAKEQSPDGSSHTSVVCTEDDTFYAYTVTSSGKGAIRLYCVDNNKLINEEQDFYRDLPKEKSVHLSYYVERLHFSADNYEYGQRLLAAYHDAECIIFNVTGEDQEMSHDTYRFTEEANIANVEWCPYMKSMVLVSLDDDHRSEAILYNFYSSNSQIEETPHTDNRLKYSYSRRVIPCQQSDHAKCCGRFTWSKEQPSGKCGQISYFSYSEDSQTYSLSTLESSLDAPLAYMCNNHILKCERTGGKNGENVRFNVKIFDAGPLRDLGLAKGQKRRRNCNSTRSDRSRLGAVPESDDEANKSAFVRYVENADSPDKFYDCIRYLVDKDYRHRNIKDSTQKAHRPCQFRKGLVFDSKYHTHPKVYCTPEDSARWRKNSINEIFWKGIDFTSDRMAYDSKFITRLLENGQHYRACLVSILVGDMHSCNKILTELSQSLANSLHHTPEIETSSYATLDSESHIFDADDIAIWLSVHNTENWKRIIPKIENKIRKHPSLASSWYLQVLINFLDKPNECPFPKLSESADLVNGPPDISNVEYLVDVVAYKLIYSPRNEFFEFCDRFAMKSQKDGSLPGLILTGITMHDGYELLQNYVDRTANFELAAELSLCGKSDFQSFEPVKGWIKEYTNLLNQRRKYKARIQFEKRKGKHQSIARSQSYAQRCDKCKHLSRPKGTITERMTPMHGHKMKIRCEKCEYVLPRCSVCELNLGYAGLPEHTPVMGLGPSYMDDGYGDSDGGGYQSDTGSDKFWQDNNKNKKAVIWCKKCNHVSHVSCAIKWFGDSYTFNCAVSNCACHCNQLDKHVS